MWMGVIFYLSHQTGEKLGSVLPLFQKLFPAMQSFNWGHFVAYFILAIAVYYGLGPKHFSWKGKLLTVLICAVYGVTDEIHQMFVDDRTPDIIDIRNDVIGAALAVGCLSIPFVHRLFAKLPPKMY